MKRALNISYSPNQTHPNDIGPWPISYDKPTHHVWSLGFWPQIEPDTIRAQDLSFIPKFNQIVLTYFGSFSVLFPSQPIDISTRLDLAHTYKSYVTSLFFITLAFDG